MQAEMDNKTSDALLFGGMIKHLDQWAESKGFEIECRRFDDPARLTKAIVWELEDDYIRSMRGYRVDGRENYAR
jgi:hypothetical protein